MPNSLQEPGQWEQQRSTSCRGGGVLRDSKADSNILQLSRTAASGKVGAKSAFPFTLTFPGVHSWGQFKGNCANTPVSSVSHPLLLEVQSVGVAPRLPAMPTALANAEQRDETCQLFLLLLSDATTTMLFVFKIQPPASLPFLGGVSPADLVTEKCLW